MRIKVLSAVFAAIVVVISLTTLHMANADSVSELFGGKVVIDAMNPYSEKLR